jgi:hypothetical protein
MRSLNTTLVLSALRILVMFASPAFAQEPHRHSTSGLDDPSGRGVYDVMPQSAFQSGVIPGYAVIPGYDWSGTTVAIPNPDYR